MNAHIQHLPSRCLGLPKPKQAFGIPATTASSCAPAEHWTEPASRGLLPLCKTPSQRDGLHLTTRLRLASQNKGANHLFVHSVAHREAVAAFRTATGKHFAAIGSAHTVTESVLVCFLAIRRLECTFHLSVILLFLLLFRFSDCKSSHFFANTQAIGTFLATF